MTLGLFPDCASTRSTRGQCGRRRLAHGAPERDKRREANERARWVEFVEIATDPAFEKEFMQAMHIPHMKDKSQT